MTLTIGTGPFGPGGGRFNFTREGPAHVLYWEDSPRRVRVEFAGQVVADSRRTKLQHETGLLPVYYFPVDDVRTDLLTPTDTTTYCPWKGHARYWSVRVGERSAADAVWGYDEPLESAPPLAGYRAFDWAAMDRWLEEDDEVLVHPRDPYHRIDALPSSRHVQVAIDGHVLADSTRPVALFEAGLPTRWYLPTEDVATDLLTPSDTETDCPYKGRARYHHVEVGGTRHPDLVWSYPEPNDGVERIAGRLCFYDERVDVVLDGEPRQRPVTQFA